MVIILTTPYITTISNNTNNFEIHYSGCCNNTLNITKQSGKNINRGLIWWQLLGQADGTGYSETCDDSNPLDGICDEAYIYHHILDLIYQLAKNGCK